MARLVEGRGWRVVDMCGDIVKIAHCSGMFKHETKEVQRNHDVIASTAAAANDDPVAEAEVSGSKDLDLGFEIWGLPKLLKLSGHLVAVRVCRHQLRLLDSYA